jgi:hypothetical protein
MNGTDAKNSRRFVDTPVTSGSGLSKKTRQVPEAWGYAESVERSSPLLARYRWRTLLASLIDPPPGRRRRPVSNKGLSVLGGSVAASRV